MGRIVKPKEVVVFATGADEEPFTQWLYSLKDPVTRQRVLVRLKRLEQGNYGDCASVGDGVNELRLFFGSGYRVYFGETLTHIVVLLCGGDKATQKKDIKQAKAYWREYRENEEI